MILAAAVAATGCFPETELASGGFTCRSDVDCGSGLRCEDGRCVAPPPGGEADSGSGPDAGDQESGGDLSGCAIDLDCLGENSVCENGQCVVREPGSTDGGEPGDGGADGGGDAGPAQECSPPCDLPNAVSGCVNFTCVIERCEPGWVNQNRKPEDGCEFRCTPSGPEVCDNKDNNCNGVVDDGFDKANDVKNCGECGRECSSPATATAICNQGKCGFLCRPDFFDNDGDPANGCESQNCQKTSDSEACDGKDNNCNGAIDEGFNKNAPETCGDACIKCLVTAPNTTSVCRGGVCVAGSCKSGWVDADRDPSNGCEYQCARTADPAEVCDGADNDCNPATPDGMQDPRMSEVCDSGKPGVCAQGAPTCEQGKLGCKPQKSPSDEKCNGLDDDCDGETDEGAGDCPADQICAQGKCAAKCNGECKSGERKCDGERQVIACGDYDNDPCLEYGPVNSCDLSEKCSAGECVCINECESGAVRCSNDGKVQSCGNTDSDSCLEWESGKSCGSGLVCNEGKCASTDPCANIVCIGVQTCVNGKCEDICTDECKPAAVKCSGAQVQGCGQADADSCLEWTPARACPAGQTCQGDKCAEIMGCSDGKHEGVNDGYTIFACKGGWDAAGVDTPSRCGRKAGDDSSNPNGTGCSAADLCATGFHLCDGKNDIAKYGGCNLRNWEQGFWMTSQNSENSNACAGGGYQDVYGCGTLGRSVSQGCSPLTRRSTAACYNERYWNAPDILFGDDGWSCSGSYTEEGRYIKHAGGRNGGVLCCRD
ncbi:MAG: hypothetical protein GMKNLPBB_02455 [Myxococcota bacterium]|nr:hypothetical protein [Myxococcota bacterium]